MRSDRIPTPPLRAEGRAGRLVAVVGPSGVGKDSVMAGLAARHPQLLRVRRAITRPPEPEGEGHEPLGPEMFQLRAARGDFVLHWRAHGLDYGIPATVLPQLAAGSDALVNLSRGVLGEATLRFARFEVLSLTADPQVLATRLAGRGRESVGEIAARLARRTDPLPPGIVVHEIRNDGTLEEAVAAASCALYPERG